MAARDAAAICAVAVCGLYSVEKDKIKSADVRELCKTKSNFEDVFILHITINHNLD